MDFEAAAALEGGMRWEWDRRGDGDEDESSILRVCAYECHIVGAEWLWTWRDY